MTVSEIINKSEKTAFSFEVLPPIKGTGTKSLFHSIDILKEFNPAYINITTHRSEYVYSEQPDGTFLRTNLRRRPGSVAVASAIMNRYGIKMVPHVLCSGFTKEETEYMLLDLQFLGITDLLVLRGDKARDEARFKPVKGGYSHTTELIQQVNDFNAGRFVDGSIIKSPGQPFSYGVACYPEKHDEAPNMDIDIHYLKMKQDMGAEYAVTQLFFDNKRYFDFVEKARKAGISIPIIPGIKPLTRMSQITVVPETFHVDLPMDLAQAAIECKNDDEVEQVGVEWCVQQCKELMEHHVPSIHFYLTSASNSIRKVAERIY